MSDPVVWVSVTEAGAATTEESLSEVRDAVREALGGDYSVVVATDKVRLATQEDIQRLSDELARLGSLDDLPSEQERYEDMGGLTVDEAMGPGEAEEE